MVNDEGELTHYAFFANTKPVNVTEALKDLKYMKAMMDELKSIEVNKTWSQVELPQGKKTIYVKWV